MFATLFAPMATIEVFPLLKLNFLCLYTVQAILIKFYGFTAVPLKIAHGDRWHWDV